MKYDEQKTNSMIIRIIIIIIIIIIIVIMKIMLRVKEIMP